jgi:hypothetical protein
MYLPISPLSSTGFFADKNCQFGSTTTRKAGGLDFTAVGGKRQGREVPQSLRVEPGAEHPVWETQLPVYRDSLPLPQL